VFDELGFVDAFGGGGADISPIMFDQGSIADTAWTPSFDSSSFSPDMAMGSGTGGFDQVGPVVTALADAGRFDLIPPFLESVGFDTAGFEGMGGGIDPLTPLAESPAEAMPQMPEAAPLDTPSLMSLMTQAPPEAPPFLFQPQQAPDTSPVMAPAMQAAQQTPLVINPEQQFSAEALTGFERGIQPPPMGAQSFDEGGFNVQPFQHNDGGPMGPQGAPDVSQPDTFADRFGAAYPAASFNQRFVNLPEAAYSGASSFDESGFVGPSYPVETHNLTRDQVEGLHKLGLLNGGWRGAPDLGIEAANSYEWGSQYAQPRENIPTSEYAPGGRADQVVQEVTEALDGVGGGVDIREMLSGRGISQWRSAPDLGIDAANSYEWGSQYQQPREYIPTSEYANSPTQFPFDRDQLPLAAAPFHNDGGPPGSRSMVGLSDGPAATFGGEQPEQVPLPQPRPYAYDNSAAVRSYPVTHTLESRIADTATNVYGPGSRGVIYSGGQEKPFRDPFTGKMSSTRHNLDAEGRGQAADVKFYDPQGKLVSNPAAAGQYWASNGWGGAAPGMRGGGIHLDQHTDRAPTWSYPGTTPDQRAAIQQGLAGRPPASIPNAPRESAYAHADQKPEAVKAIDNAVKDKPEVKPEVAREDVSVKGGDKPAPGYVAPKNEVREYIPERRSEGLQERGRSGLAVHGTNQDRRARRVIWTVPALYRRWTWQQVREGYRPRPARPVNVASECRLCARPCRPKGLGVLVRREEGWHYRQDGHWRECPAGHTHGGKRRPYRAQGFSRTAKNG
jgi:hypothetical protein